MTPTTLAGAQAVARAALAKADHNLKGEIDIYDHPTRLLFKAIGWLAGEVVA